MTLTLAQFESSAVSLVNVMVNVYHVHQVFFTSLTLKRSNFKQQIANRDKNLDVDAFAAGLSIMIKNEEPLVSGSFRQF